MISTKLVGGRVSVILRSVVSGRYMAFALGDGRSRVKQCRVLLPEISASVRLRRANDVTGDTG